MDQIFSNKILHLLNNLNKVTIKDALQRGCKSFYVENKMIGLIRPDFWEHLKNYTDVFQLVEVNASGHTSTLLKPGAHLSSSFKTHQERTIAIHGMLENLRQKNIILPLRGWRNENYSVSQKFTDEPLLEIERSACGLFGTIQYGVHVNGFVKSLNGEIKIWLGKRSKTKQTFPSMYDNLCAGGLTARLGILECVKKECKEEASISDELLEDLTFVGTISYFYEDERGLFPECQFVYDLELPGDFTPVNADGEVAEFLLVSLEELKDLLVGGNFKPNCAAICLEFLIRHGYLNPDSDPNVSYYIEQLHSPLQTYYDGR
ncbi:nudix hydrolase 24 chloroplastic-like isoform X3 [Biomphalaria pfeifferi]|uniref:Nudix hydrolase 24 chloroplastic-like isoform X3 n=1 Tax=Biomphalaria pfeifferi TaxID=112525 RepID=A0AAD8BYF9_BIOPF|nr:nudix hydrolase 24 chloroplastic-like isoform X3 [Biomphalaria pfeifferi]